jgi:hypothetical protein
MGSELGESAAGGRIVRLDGLSVFYILLCLGWTTLVACGMVYLFRKRHLPLLKIRGLALSLGSITLLHLYAGAVLLLYIYGPVFKEVAEFWIMGLW